jgi:hypothetical protein
MTVVDERGFELDGIALFPVKVGVAAVATLVPRALHRIA